MLKNVLLLCSQSELKMDMFTLDSRSESFDTVILSCG